MIVQEFLDESPERFVGDLRGSERFEFGEHLLGVEARVLQKIEFREAVLAIALFDRTNRFQFDLRAVLFVFVERPANLEELSDLPVRLAFVEETAVGPDHQARGASRVAKATRVERPPFASATGSPLDQLHEEVRVLPRLHLAQFHHRRFACFRHARPPDGK